MTTFVRFGCNENFQIRITSSNLKTFLFFSGAKVIFTAVADRGGKVGPFDSDTTLKFESVVTNAGNGYDPTSGRYITFAIFYKSGSDKVYDS